MRCLALDVALTQALTYPLNQERFFSFHEGMNTLSPRAAATLREAIASLRADSAAPKQPGTQ